MRFMNMRVSAYVVAYGLIGFTVAQVDLGTAAPFAVIASQAITDADYGNTIIEGYLGLYPNTESSITGFDSAPPGAIHAGDDVARLAIQDVQSAYDAAASQIPTVPAIGAELGGQTLFPSTYRFGSAVEITGLLTLDAQNDPNALFIFQIGSTLTTASASTILLVNGAQACNIFFQVGSSATLGSTTVFNGNILAQTSISLNDGVEVNGGLYALQGAVTLINDRVTAQQACPVTPKSSTISAVIFTSTPDAVTTLMDPTGSVSEPGVMTTVSEEGLISTTSLGDIPTIISATLMEDISTTTSIGFTEETRDVTSITSIDGTLTSVIAPSSVSTAFSDGNITTISIDQSAKTFISSQPEIPLPSDLTTTVVSSSVVINTLSGSDMTTFISSLATNATNTLPKTRSLFSSVSKSSSRISGYSVQPWSSPSRPVENETRPTIQTSYLTNGAFKSRMTTKPIISATKLYPVYFPTRVLAPYGQNQTRSKNSTQTGHASSPIAITSQANSGTTNLNGTPCTTLSYYEPTCSCTQTTIVPIAYTPTRQIPAVAITTVSGVPCTTVRYYEEACDCLRTSNVPIQVVSASANIATFINEVPCITTKYYEPICDCIQTATVPVRIASAGETPAAAAAAAEISNALPESYL